MRAGSSVAMTDLRQLFQDELLEHYRHPRHTGPLPSPAVVVERAHRTCGDRVRVELDLDPRRRLALALRTTGCAVATAAGSLLACWIQGRELSTARRGLSRFARAVESGRLASDDPNEARVLAAIHPFATRRGCALLPVEAVEEALRRLEVVADPQPETEQQE